MSSVLDLVFVCRHSIESYVKFLMLADNILFYTISTDKVVF